MKLWDKEESVHKKIDSFTVGKDREYDKVIAQYDCEASIAHVKMLCKINLIKDKEAVKLIKELKKIKEISGSKDFIIEEDFEDISHAEQAPSAIAVSHLPCMSPAQRGANRMQA